MKPSVARAVYALGARVRNPSIWGELKRLKASEFLGRQELLDLQLRRARSFLTFAGAHSPFLRARFDAAGLEPAKLATLDELQRLPPISKSELVAHGAEVHTRYAFSSLITAETSGTSGDALEFKKNEEWDSAVRAHLMRAYDWYGVKVWERSGYLWGYDIAPGQARRIRVLDGLQNRFRIFSYEEEALVRFARKLSKARFLAGYSSMIYEVAKRIVDLGIPMDGIQMVKGTSEMILDAYQPVSERAFGKRIVSEYGAAEAGLIAFECPAGSMHINVEDVIVETDENGEILVTNLLSHSFPVVRYRLGDVVDLSDDACPCGRAHPILRSVVGRRGGTLYGHCSEYPAFTFYYVFKNLALRHSILMNYRVVQSRRGQAMVMIEGGRDQEQERLVASELGKYFSEDVEFEMSWVPAFERGQKKAQYFESHIETRTLA